MSSVPAPLTYRFDDIELDTMRSCLRRGGQEIHLRAKTFQILVYLVANRERVISKEELLEQFWKDTAISEDVLAHSIAELRRALGDNSKEPLYLKTVPKRGYRFVGEVREVPIVALVASEQITTVQVREEYSDERPGREYSRWVLAAALLLVAVTSIAGLAAWWLRHPEPSTTLPQTAGHHPVLVLFFENQSHSQEVDWLREGLADMIIADLSRTPGLDVLSRQQVATLLNRAGWNRGSATRLEDALALARRARAQALVLGTFARMGNTLRVTAQVHRASDGALVKTEVAAAERPEHIIGEMGLLALKLARDLGGKRERAPASETSPITGNLEAYRAYSEGVEEVAALKLPEGIQLLERATQLDPQFAAAYAELGNAYAVTWGRGTEGKPYLEKAFALSGRLTELQRMYVAAWYALANDDFEEAIRSFRRIVARYPAEAEAYCSLGRLLEGEGRYSDAIEAERQAVVADPDAPLVHNFLARVYCRAGRFVDAVNESKRYIELSGGEPNAYDSLGTSYVWQGKYDEAEVAYRAALTRKPDFDVALVHLAGVHYREGRYRDAITECRQYLRISSADIDESRGNAWLAWIYLRRGDLAQAREASSRESSRSGPLAWLSRMLIALQSGDLKAARKALETAGTVPERGNRGSDRYRPFARGLLALAEGKADDAIAEFRQVLRQPEPVGYIDWFDDCLGDAYLRLGRLDDAVAEYKRVLTRNPNAALARYHLAVALERKGDRPSAREEYRRFVDTWKLADPDIAELRNAKIALVHHT
jgi:tetratricopeptide (TPR) repeat protein/DNA-binding winged helix-turn-helix (wHTH) protein